MQRLLSIALSCLFAVSLSAQEPSITYPYNPDSNTDSLIGASDLVDFLPFYGEEFTPEPLTIEGMSVEEWMEQQTASSGGGCDWGFPEGLDGEGISLSVSTVNPYVVPDGKRLYILGWNNNNSFWPHINGIKIAPPAGQPLILNSGQELSSNVISAGFNGYLVDESSFVTAVTYTVSYYDSYVVPDGKKLYVLGWNNSDSFWPRIDGVIVRYQSSQDQPLVLNSGQELSSSGNSRGFNGYLVDEDYFADCGGGGGVDISGLQEQIDAVAADSYAADAALLTASDNADDELQAQIDEAVSNLQEQLDSALASNEDLQAQVDELQNKSIFTSYHFTGTPHNILNGGEVFYLYQDLEDETIYELNIPVGKSLYIKNTSGLGENISVFRNGEEIINANSTHYLTKLMLEGSDYITYQKSDQDYYSEQNCFIKLEGYIVDRDTSIQSVFYHLTSPNEEIIVPNGKTLYIQHQEYTQVDYLNIILSSGQEYNAQYNYFNDTKLFNSGTQITAYFNDDPTNNDIPHIIIYGYLIDTY